MRPIYSTKTIDSLIKILAMMLDAAFPGNDCKVTMKAGTLSETTPWLMHVHAYGELRRKLGGIDAVEVLFHPIVFLDQVDNGGLVAMHDYAEGIFGQILGRFSDHAVDPVAFMREVRTNMQAKIGGIITPE